MTSSIDGLFLGLIFAGFCVFVLFKITEHAGKAINKDIQALLGNRKDDDK